jgi:hypothetical protein
VPGKISFVGDVCWVDNGVFSTTARILREPGPWTNAKLNQLGQLPAKVSAYRKSNSIQIKRITFVNDKDANMEITLYHSDNPLTPFRTWKVDKNTEYTLAIDGNDINIGDDWGIRLNYVDDPSRMSKITLVGEVMEPGSDPFRIRTSAMFK